MKGFKALKFVSQTRRSLSLELEKRLYLINLANETKLLKTLDYTKLIKNLRLQFCFDVYVVCLIVITFGPLTQLVSTL